MKVFLSWSGELSHHVACVFRDWLPSVIQSIKPYVSSEDIDKGARWTTDIAKELEAATFGILIITRDNVNAPWINFEAGALSKTIDKSRVAPFLFKMKRSEIVEGPLLQFQSTIYEKEDIKKLIFSINSALPVDDQLEERRLIESAEVWWPLLTTKLDVFSSQLEDNAQAIADSPPSESAILEEMLELLRSQSKILRSPDMLLPLDYLYSILLNTLNSVDARNNIIFNAAVSKVIGELFAFWEELDGTIASECDLSEDTKRIIAQKSSQLRTPLLWLSERFFVDVHTKRVVCHTINIDTKD